MDVKLAFFNGCLEEEDITLVHCRRARILGIQAKYRSLQTQTSAPQAWNSRIDTYYTQNDFFIYLYEHALYVKSKSQRNILFICLFIYR
jgi:hypothetical protein